MNVAWKMFNMMVTVFLPTFAGSGNSSSEGGVLSIDSANLFSYSKSGGRPSSSEKKR